MNLLIELVRGFLRSIYWVFESQWWVVIQHTIGLVKCIRAGSLTAAIVLTWAPLMCFPQWLIAPAFGWHLETWSIFAARMLSMCIVRKLDGIMPLTRALGLCHLLSFGPVLTLLLMSDSSAMADPNFQLFIQSQIYVIGLCLLLDSRDFIFYLAGYPYPCYVREGVRGGMLHVEDPRAGTPVTWKSRLLGP